MTSTTDVATRNGTPAAYQQAALAISPGQSSWDEMQLAALAQIGIASAPEGDRSVFLHVCQRTGLDPFSAQIYMIPRKEWDSVAKAERVKWTIQTGIKGLRVIRDRAERREGVRGVLSRFTYYDAEDTEHKVWTRQLPPVACEVTYTVRDRNGIETPYTSVLRFTEYLQHNKDGKAMAQWAPDQKPVHMLEKCTEADVYNKAFPTDFAGVILDDAMPPAEAMTDEQLAAAYGKATQRPRATAEEIRSRPRRPQQVRAEVVPPEDAPWPGDAAPADAGWAAKAADGSRRMAEHVAEGQLLDQAAEAPNPRDDVRAWFERAGITSHDSQMNYAGGLLDIAPPASLDSLARVQAVTLAGLLAKCEGKAQLDAFLKDGTVPGSD
jgi:hypothetical protein